MQEDTLLQQAISAIRAGHELTARDIFLEIVEVSPQNETAWMWLTGLLDGLDDRIYACKQVMEINPGNVKVGQYLDQLLVEKNKQQETLRLRVDEQVRQARELVKTNKPAEALRLIRGLTLYGNVNANGWRLLADLSPELDERAHALEKFVELVPDDLVAMEELKQARHYQEHPIHQAELYEERGEIDKALMSYRRIALKPESKEEWNKVYWKIIQLENLQQEHIAHVSPSLSIARLTAGPPLVYFMFVLVQVGVNPFAHSDPLFWFGMLWVMLGGFMIALASVRSHNRLWMLLFKDVGASGTPPARLVTAMAGWILVLLPHVMLFVSAWQRLLGYFFNIMSPYLQP
jgi:tetratricopeptide (TPR) repeat protein